MLRAIAFLSVSLAVLSAQNNRVSPEMIYHRVWAVVPLIGKGTADDPRRPMFALSPAEQTAKLKKGDSSGIIGYTMQLSDDGKSALVEFVGASPAELKFIVDSKAAGVKAFDRGAATKEQIEQEFQKYKTGFALSTLAGQVPTAQAPTTQVGK